MPHPQRGKAKKQVSVVFLCHQGDQGIPHALMLLDKELFPTRVLESRASHASRIALFEAFGMQSPETRHVNGQLDYDAAAEPRLLGKRVATIVKYEFRECRSGEILLVVAHHLMIWYGLYNLYWLLPAGLSDSTAAGLIPECRPGDLVVVSMESPDLSSVHFVTMAGPPARIEDYHPRLVIAGA